jgi:LuxR family transcriptional regulator
VDDILDRIGAIGSALTVDTAWQLGAAHFRALGFARITYAMTRYRTDRSIGHPDDAVFLTTTSPEYRAFYLRNNFFARTPIYRWVMQNTGGTTWSWVQRDLAAGRLTPQEAEAVRQNAAWDVVAGITLSFADPDPRRRAALGLIADRGIDAAAVEALWAARRAEVTAVGQVLHLKLLSLPGTATRRGLTRRQREVLAWVADGKTTADIALLLDLSTAMVEKHLRLAREALDVETTAQAVAKATLLNLIFAETGPVPAR